VDIAVGDRRQVPERSHAEGRAALLAAGRPELLVSVQVGSVRCVVAALCSNWLQVGGVFRSFLRRRARGVDRVL